VSSYPAASGSGWPWPAPCSPWAEAELYERFLEITSGVTTIVISHRFSTVRVADRIVVIEGGRNVEEGSHAQLMALRGRYEEMFTYQASAYRDEAGLDA
jgi:ATP-binding cassette, subfamily B, bacterial